MALGKKKKLRPDDSGEMLQNTMLDAVRAKTKEIYNSMKEEIVRSWRNVARNNGPESAQAQSKRLNPREKRFSLPICIVFLWALMDMR